MKRLILSIFSLLIVSISTVFAAIPDSEFAIGGVTIGSSADYVQSIYGEPTHISDKVPNAEGGYSYSYAYGASFYIFFDANTNVVTGIFSTANNGLTTPVGLTVGMDADAIEQAYGEPWKNDRGYIFIMKKENGWYLQLITERLQKLSCLIMLCKFEISHLISVA